MAIFTQKQRHINITTPLGADKLLLLGLQGSEGISRLFNFDLSLFSEDQGIAFADIIGKGVTVSIELPSGGYRYFNGIISSFSQTSGESASGDDSTRGSQYRATLVPKFWLLTRSADLRIFQKMTVPDIVEKVLGEFGITDKEIKLQKKYEPREYCVQYRETHFNFISRLLEEEGIFYYFEHKDDKHRLIITDSSQASANCPGQSSASYQIEGTTSEDDTISFIEKVQMIQAGKYMLRDFNFETPGNSLEVNDPGGKNNLGPSGREIYDYPGGYNAKALGDKLVRVRMEEEEAQITTVRGASVCRSFTAGYRFKLLNSYRQDMNDKEYILSAVTHTMSHSVQEGGAFSYSNRFSCIPADVPFHPPRVTPKPVVQGTQTAIVVGPSGDEIHTDEFGRVKVQFHWDRRGKGDENSSCWIRVSQLWAGSGWGAMFIPRIGHEVIVDFLEGDPDCPIITGRVYHGTNMPPYTLPGEHETKSTIKSYSSKGGGGFNELRFEDKKGEEQVFIHGEKQMDVRVKKDSLEWIGNERHLIVIKDQLEKVDGDKHLTVTGDQNEKVDGSVSLKVGSDKHQKVTGAYAVDASGEIHLKGMKVIIEGSTQITLKVGSNFVDIGPAGVTMSGTKVHVEGSGVTSIIGGTVLINSGGSGSSAGSGSGASPDAPKAPKEADKAEPGKAATASSGSAAPASSSSSQSSPPGPQAAALHQAAQSGAPFCDT